MSTQTAFSRMRFATLMLLLLLLSFSTACVSSLLSLYTNPNSEKTVLRVSTLRYKANETIPTMLPLSSAIKTNFKTGEALQFRLSSNRPGFLYVLHRDPQNKFHALYPLQQKNEKDNKITPYEDFFFPKTGKFFFRNKPGSEFLLFVLSSVSLMPNKMQERADAWLPFRDPTASAPSTLPDGEPPCGPEYMEFGICEIILPLQGKRLVYDIDRSRAMHITKEGDYIMLPQSNVQAGAGHHAFVSFRLRHTAP